MENLFLNQPKKDIKIVVDYNKKRQLEMFKFSCFNASASIYSGVGGVTPLVKDVFDFAEALYNEAIKRDYLKLEVTK